jgi:hypothetical protein
VGAFMVGASVDVLTGRGVKVLVANVSVGVMVAGVAASRADAGKASGTGVGVETFRQACNPSAHTNKKEIAADLWENIEKAARIFDGPRECGRPPVNGCPGRRAVFARLSGLIPEASFRMNRIFHQPSGKAGWKD